MRRSRWMVVRGTYPQLKRSTIPTWQAWFNDQFGAFTWGPPPSQRIIQAMGDGTVLHMEILFTALDGPDAEADLRGFEGTGIWLNELSEIPRGVLTFALGRIGDSPDERRRVQLVRHHRRLRTRRTAITGSIGSTSRRRKVGDSSNSRAASSRSADSGSTTRPRKTPNICRRATTPSSLPVSPRTGSGCSWRPSSASPSTARWCSRNSATVFRGAPAPLSPTDGVPLHHQAWTSG